jgi:carbon monoxide dehydrogenase subunit G
MNVHGQHTLSAPPAAVFDAVCDPRVLLAVIPGCEWVDQTGPGEYRAQISLRLPGMVGRYSTTVRMVDPDPPHSAVLEGRLEGRLGSITGRADFRLQPTPGGTSIQYKGHAVIDGPLARLDSRFAERLAESLIDQGLEALDAQLRVGAAR